MNQIHPMQDPYAVNSTGQPQELFGSESLQIPLLSILVALGPKSAFLKLPLCMLKLKIVGINHPVNSLENPKQVELAWLA